MNYSERQTEDLIKAIFDGEINPTVLPKNLYLAIVGHLTDGVEKGFGLDFKYESDPRMLKALKENVVLFSGAKTFNFVISTEGLIAEEGKILPFKIFMERAKELYDLHNKTWLEVEYNTAIGQAQLARDWQGYQENKDIAPYLRYVTVHDKNVSEICRACDGVVRKVDDKFWASNSPLQHYQCRCHLESVSEAVETNSIKIDLIAKPDKVFQNNAGVTGEVFNKHHPYFADIPKKYEKLAKRNFDL